MALESAFELVLDSTLAPRPDRPARVPLPPPDSTACLAVRRSVNVNSSSVNATTVQTLWLNADSHSEHPQLLSRSHAELFWQSGQCIVHDGSRRERKQSCNGTSIDGVLVPLGGSAPLAVGATLQFGAPESLPAVPGKKRSTVRPREFLYTLRRVADAPFAGRSADAGSSGAEGSQSAGSGKKRQRVTPPADWPRAAGRALASASLLAAASKFISGADQDLHEAVGVCSDALSPGCESLILGRVHGAYTPSRSLEVLVSSLLSSSSGREGAASIGEESLEMLSREEEEHAAQLCAALRRPSTSAQRLLQLALSRLGFAPPADLLMRTVRDLVLPSVDEAAAVSRTLSAAAAMRAHAAAAIATGPLSLGSPCAEDVAAHRLLDGVLRMAAAAIRLGVPRAGTWPSARLSPALSGDAGPQHRSALLAMLCSMLARAPSLASATSSAIEPREAHVVAAFLVFDSCAAASVTSDADPLGSESARSLRDHALERAASELAARVLSRAPHEATLRHIERRIGEVCSQVGSSGGGGSGRGDLTLFDAELELRGRDAMLTALGAFAEANSSASQLLGACLGASLRPTRFTLLREPPSRARYSDARSSVAMRVLRARPSAAVDLSAAAWEELAVLVRHAVQFALRLHLDGPHADMMHASLAELRTDCERKPGAERLGVTLRILSELMSP